jgi:serine/threonine protein kinase
MSDLQSPSNHCEVDKRSCKAHIEDPPHPSSQVLGSIGLECNMSDLQFPSNHFEADKRSCEAHIEDPPHPSSQVLGLIGLECNMSGLQSPSSHFEADKRSCKAHIEDPPHPSSQVLEPICPWRENRWQLLGRLVLLNKKKCEHFPRWFISAGECCHLIARASATREFCAAIERAKYLLEECSYDEWLLKAVELWECTEHFVEVLLDLCWSAYIMNLVVGSIERSEKWMSSVEELVKSRSEQNDVARLFHENCNEKDKLDLKDMVEEKLADKTLKVDCEEHQLAHLLQDRLKNQSSWQPPFLKRHSFYIFKDFIVPLQRSSKTGAHGAILKFPWVYGKEFAMKMGHPKEDGQKSLKNPLTPTFMCPFLLMESLECDLKDLMDRCKRYNSAQEGFGEGFSELETINLMLPVAKALRFLHGKDVAHRDLKSQNILCKNVNLQEDREGSIVREDSIVKLIDFGEARINVSNIADGDRGRAGTPGYMDPTMWKQDVVGYTLFMGDVFSFAMVFAELLTWRSPSEAFGVQLPRDAQTRLKADKRPPLPNGLPNYVRFIVESCWHVDHLKRPDFNAICLMLQHAKILLLDKDFAYEPEDLFSYEDATGGECCISDQL